MKQRFPLSKVHQLLGFGPVVLITSSYKDNVNIMPISWLTPVDFDPPKIALIIGDQSYTYKLITRSKELVINIPSEKMLQTVIGCGNCSGSKVNKFKRFRLTPLPSKKISTPGIAECAVNIECKVVDDSLAKKYNIFIVEAKACLVEKGLFKDYYRVDKSISRPLLNLDNGYFSAPNKVIKG